MEGHNERHTPVTSDGKLSVVLENGDGTSSVALKKNFLNDHLRKVLSSGPLSPEQLAEIWDEAPTRRSWWLDLHSSADIHVGTTISDLQAAVGRADGGRSEGSNNTAPRNGSNGQPAAAPVFVEYETSAPVCFGSLTTSDDLMMPVCACSRPVAWLKPFDWQCAKCKGVIPSPSLLTDEQRRDYLEANQTQKMKARKRRSHAGMPGTCGLNSRRPGGRYRHGINMQVVKDNIRQLRQAAMLTGKQKSVKRFLLAIGNLMGMSNRRGRA